MKLLFNTLLLFSLIFRVTAQTALIRGMIPSMKGATISVGRPTKWLIYNSHKEGTIESEVSKDGGFNLDLGKIDKEIIFFSVWDKQNDSRLFFQYLYITKGDNLFLLEDFDKQIRISGKSEKYNSQLQGLTNQYFFANTEQDSLPDRVYNGITDNYQKFDKVIREIKEYNQAPSDFIEAWNYHLKYFKLASFYYTYGNSSRKIKSSVKWTNQLNELIGEVEISNDKALIAPAYCEFLRFFLMRKHDALRDDYEERPAVFYNEWFGGDSLKGKAIMEIDYTNQLKQKIIERYFTGKVKEHLYGLLFDSMIHDQHFFNAKSVFNDFERQYPNSQYIKYFKKPIQEAVARLENTIPKKAIFLDSTTTAKWGNILEHFKGKTVFLDMWGTWCSPCREEIEKNAAVLKKHFDGKGVEFLYVTNYDKSETKWKQLIAFYNLEGSHVFANEALTNEIMEKINGSSFPSYAIIDKTGKIAKVEYPINRDELIEQIETTLKK